MTDFMKLSEFFMDELPDNSPWSGNIKGLVEKLIAAGVTFAADNNVSHKWISVKDQLPEPETTVLAVRHYHVAIFTYRYDKYGDLEFMYMDDCGYWCKVMRPKITHWMPLPEPPKEE